MTNSYRPDEFWDDVVVGAGSCGSVLASRLSEQPDRRVLVLEAGRDSDRNGSGAPRRPDTPILSGSHWDYEATVGSEAPSRRVPYRVGRLVGGSSAVNGAIALRGLPGDFDAWAAAGNGEWAWRHVRPHFVALENDAGFGGAEHGRDGPVPIERRPVHLLDGVSVAFWQACRTLGLPDLPDLNGGAAVGIGPVPTNTRGGRRMSTAQTHLAAARGRPNLTIRDRSPVRRVLFTRGRATGVEVVGDDGHVAVVAAGRITLCAGAINTPMIMMRSGLGTPDRVAALGIRPVAELRGVGENLADHPAIAIWSVLRAGAPRPDRCETSVMARVALRSGMPDASLSLIDSLSVPDVPGVGPLLGGRTGVSVVAALLTPASRGVVRLRPGQLDGPPAITLRLASEPGDVERLAEATRLAWSVIRTPPLRELVDRTLLWTERMVTDARLLRAAVPRFVAPMWHPAGTSRMGPPQDPTAVVDQFCRVHRVDGLNVVDASVMPSIPAAPLNLTCIAIAERAAEWMSGTGRR